MAKAGLEAALWDALARARGLSLARMLGGVRDRVPVGVSVGLQANSGRPGPQGRGLSRRKATAGSRSRSPRAGTSRWSRPCGPRSATSRCRSTPTPPSAWTTPRSSRPWTAKACCSSSSPSSHEDIFDHAKLQSRLRTPICLDESIHSLADARAAVELESCRVINIKPGRVGRVPGIDGHPRFLRRPRHPGLARRHARVGHRPGRQRGPGLARRTSPCPATSRPAAATTSRTSSSRSSSWGRTRPWPSRPGPGLGVEVVPDRLARVTERIQEFRAG